MNFLAHFYLSGDNEELIVGNFIADHVKGSNIRKFSEGIQAGILLHREIDTFTDAHPVFLESKKRLTTKYRKYAGVIVDMFYDHFLSANWRLYSNENLESFTNRMYEIIIQRYPVLPEKSQRFIAYMKRFNWLTGYGNLQGLKRALQGMANRTPFESKMEEAVIDLQTSYSLFREEFFAFFPKLIDFTKEKEQMLSNKLPDNSV
jgi:acyl carrier protein phosphodiesterase